MIIGDALTLLHFSISLGHVGLVLFLFWVSLLVPNMTELLMVNFSCLGRGKKMQKFLKLCIVCGYLGQLGGVECCYRSLYEMPWHRIAFWHPYGVSIDNIQLDRQNLLSYFFFIVWEDNLSCYIHSLFINKLFYFQL